MSGREGGVNRDQIQKVWQSSFLRSEHRISGVSVSIVREKHVFFHALNILTWHRSHFQ